MKRPWAKFYYGDWRNDPLLRMCGLTARGLWIEMIALMHQAEPYGHLIVNGRPPTDAQLAIQVGAPEVHLPALLVELESAGVFSRTRTGVIYSRRMTREDKHRKDGERSAQTGEIPGSRRHRQRTEKPPEILPPPPVVSRVVDQPPAPQKLEARKINTKEIIDSLGAISRGKRLGPNYDDPAERKARWQQKMFEEVRKRLPSKNAELIIEGYMSGEREAIEFIEEVDASVKARRAAGAGR